jgi:hypothetical protein
MYTLIMLMIGCVAIVGLPVMFVLFMRAWNSN